MDALFFAFSRGFLRFIWQTVATKKRRKQAFFLRPVIITIVVDGIESVKRTRTYDMRWARRTVNPEIHYVETLLVNIEGFPKRTPGP